MAVGLASGIANSVLDALCRNTAWSQPAAVWVKLHTGDPGSAGASNAATETTRKQATFAASSGGSATTSADLAWTSVAGTEDYTHYSAWTLSAAGTFLFSGVITANAVVAGDNFTISAGSLTATLTNIAA